jgi:hypothetical protein
MTGSDVEDHFWNEEGIEARCAVAFSKIDHLFLEGDQSANTAGKHYTHAVWIRIVCIYARIQNSLVACNDSSLSKAVELPCFLPVKEVSRFKVFDLASESCFKLGSVEIGNKITSADAITQIIPVFCN